MTYIKLLVFDGLQGDLRNNKIIEDKFTKGRHHKLGIIQCQQFTQDTAHIEKANTDCFVLYPSFSISSCEYFHRKFSATLEPEAIKKLCDYAKKVSRALQSDEPSSNKVSDPQNRYLIITDDESISLGYDLHVIPTSPGQNFVIKKINYDL